MNRKLASIQRVESVESIPGADNIEKIKILGWNVVSLKNEFKPGNLAVFCEIDSLLPSDNPKFSFMEKYKYRVKTIKLRGVISQGLAFPLSILKDSLVDLSLFNVGDDVTEPLRITKWESPIIKMSLFGGKQVHISQREATFPFFVPRTDEIRIQSEPSILDEIRGLPSYITVKVDGTSMTVGQRDNDFFVCSRNHRLPLDVVSWFLDVAITKYDLASKLSGIGNIAIAGELVGPSIQGNRLGLTERDWLVFDAYDIDKQQYYNFEEQQVIFHNLGLKPVPLVCANIVFNMTLEQLLGEADGKYSGTYWGYTLKTDNLREGIVVRPMKEIYSSTLKGRLSFKVISNQFLLRSGN